MLLLLLSWQGMLHRPADLLLLLLLTVLSMAVQMEEMSCCQSPAGRQQAAVAAAVPAAAVRLLLLLVVAGRGPAGLLRLPVERRCEHHQHSLLLQLQLRAGPCLPVAAGRCSCLTHKQQLVNSATTARPQLPLTHVRSSQVSYRARLRYQLTRLSQHDRNK